MTWSSPWAFVPAAFASLGIIFTIFTIITFIRFNATPVIMASGRELCHILLSGLLLCYTISLISLSKPTLITCTIIRIGVSLGLCICYSAILTKINRISRIFNRNAKNGLTRPSYTSPKSQVVICMCLVSIQLIFIVAWIIRDPPSVKEVVYKIGARKFAILQCGISSTATFVSLIYNMILILLCTMYAFKTRKIPDNFNETKYIVFTMYSTCIVWLAFIPIYYGTNNDIKVSHWRDNLCAIYTILLLCCLIQVQISTLSSCISISAAVTLACLFTPKLYICLFQPYKNVRSVGNKNNATMELPSSASTFRFIRPSTSTSGCAITVSPTTETVSLCQGSCNMITVEQTLSEKPSDSNGKLDFSNVE